MQNKKEQRSGKLAMVKRWQESGLSQKRFCIENNISYHVFHYWYKVYRFGSELPGSLVPLAVTAVPSQDHVTITGFNGIRLQVPVTEQSVWLIKQLLS